MKIDWYNKLTKPKKESDDLALIKSILLYIIDFMIESLICMLLWNWLMPDIFSLSKINYLQTMGLIVLGFCLFKRKEK